MKPTVLMWVMFSSDLTFFLNRLRLLEDRTTRMERIFKEGVIIYTIVFIGSFIILKYV